LDELKDTLNDAYELVDSEDAAAILVLARQVQLLRYVLHKAIPVQGVEVTLK
jgi:hypothetical protein